MIVAQYARLARALCRRRRPLFASPSPSPLAAPSPLALSPGLWQRTKTSLAEVQLAQYMATQLEDAIAEKDRHSLLLSKHVFVGAVGYFGSGSSSGGADGGARGGGARNSKNAGATGTTDTDLAAGPGSGAASGNTAPAGDMAAATAGSPEPHEAQAAADEDEASVRFIVSSLGASLDPADVQPVQLADLGG